LAKNFGDDAPKVNVNHEAAKGLQDQLALTDKEAQAIVDYRGKNGDFKTLDDLKKVPGLDGAKIDAKKDRIAF
jgi:competence protein ComEA